MTLDRTIWLRQAREVLSQDHGPQCGEIRVTLRSEEGARSCFVLAGVNAERQLPTDAALSPVEADIVACLRDHGQLIAKAIARRLNVPCDSSLRTILANLCERRPPVLASSRDGYRLAGEGKHHAG